MTGPQTIWDILKYQQDPDSYGGEWWTGNESGSLPNYAKQIYKGGEGSSGQLEYLMSLLETSEYLGDTGRDTIKTSASETGHRTIYEDVLGGIQRYLRGDSHKSWYDNYGGSKEDPLSAFLELSEDELGDYFFSNMEYAYDSHEIDKVKNMMSALQEGFKAIPTSEDFGLDRKIGDIQSTAERELKSAREGYIPGEILSRYGALQGKSGAKQKGEELEQAYTGDIYGVQRGVGRDIRDTYGDFKDEWFGGVEKWMSNIGT